MSKITAIEIENFQSIKDRVRIDLAPITLLFGPNSAGKSAVFDALELIECLWDPIRFDEAKATNMITRWARREEQVYLPLRLAVEFGYEFNKDITPRDLWEEDENWICNKARTAKPSFFVEPEMQEDYPEDFVDFEKTTIRLDIEIVMAPEGKTKIYPVITALKISNVDKSIVQFGQSVGLDLDTKIDTWDLRHYGSKTTIGKDTPFYKFSELPSEYAEAQNLECRLNLPSLDLRLNTKIQELRSINPKLDAYESHFSEIVSDLIFYFGTLVGKIFRESTPLVKADRRVPTPNESLFVVDINLGGWWDTTDPYASSSPARLLKDQFQLKDPHYSLIAHSAHISLLLKTAHHDEWGDSHAANYIEEIRSKSVYIDCINEHLEKHLFKEKLYRVECESTLMVPIDLKEEDPWGYYTLAQPAAVRILLRDGENRKLDLQDVGSGIPFVLPVLYAAVSGSLSRTQQPELHLHPALQSDLADVFLSEVVKNKDKTFVVETHSEHLLLRLLRRIRDTEKSAPSSLELPLTPKGIAIYYFDPQVEGTTFVVKQAVTPLGDFYNDWPRGFFSERDGDLFNV
jgi:hypothetical protein